MSAILALCRSLDETTFAPGETLLPEGGRTGWLLVLIEGTVEIVKSDVQIDTVSLAGAIFGEVSALIDIPHMASVRAVSAVRVYRIERAVEFFAANPDVALEVARLLAQRLSSVTSYLVNLKHQFADQQSHLAMVDEVLESLTHQQRQHFAPGSARVPDPAP